MEYKVTELARLAGVTARTIRFYDGLGLLRPLRLGESGYRLYGAEEVKRLQQILLYREMGVELKAIKPLLDGSTDTAEALRTHLCELYRRRDELDALIENVKKTIDDEKGIVKMSDSERFAGLKKSRIDENERKYGAEAREKYGDAAIDASNERVMKMDEKEYSRLDELETEVKTALTAAVATGDIHDECANRLFALHRDWLKLQIPKYTASMHKGISMMYTSDERFRKYYDDIVPGGAEYITRVIAANCE